jgi:CheY-like chemotaxis protein
MFPHVLVVDDSAVDRKIVGGLLDADEFIEIDYALNGREGLEKVDRQTPQLVLTDMIMPEMDGLTFVRELQHLRPSVPIVLMTAHGTGATAIEALHAGAASFIPKAQLSDRLLPTIRRLLGMNREEANLQRLTEYQKYIHYTFELENKTKLIDSVIGLVQRATSSIHLGRSNERLQMGIAIEQALLNAIYHGNLGLPPYDIQEARKEGNVHNLVRERAAESPYAERKIYVDIQIWRDEARFTIRDEGNGFDTSIVPTGKDPDDIDRQECHGLTLMTNLMDEIIYNDRGNEVVMIKRRDRDK